MSVSSALRASAPVNLGVRFSKIPPIQTMIKTVWIPATTTQDGHWETHNEPTGELKQGLFGIKEVKAPKLRWVESSRQTPNIVDGQRLAQEIEAVTNRLLSDGYAIMQITPITSGRYDYKFVDEPHDSPATCASWGYSVTEGVVVIASKQ